jgi:REP element-mobilizing transposase RayT
VTTPRRQLVDPDNPVYYHLVSRCVRRAWLCGVDRASRRNYNHRKDWLIQRLSHLGEAFAVDVYAYAILSNHFHLVVYYDPKAPMRWSNGEVVDRWLRVCPPRLADGSIDGTLVELRRAELLLDRDKVETLRAKLGSLSMFMKLLKQPIARRANLEDDCSGHFFEQRFYSAALLSEAAVVAAMAYVDLNPVRAKIARTLAEAKHTAIFARLQRPEALDAYLKPVVSGLGASGCLPITFADYVERLEALIITPPEHWSIAKLARWRDQVATLKKKQRVFGTAESIRAWVGARGWQLREVALAE